MFPGKSAQKVLHALIVNRQRDALQLGCDTPELKKTIRRCHRNPALASMIRPAAVYSRLFDLYYPAPAVRSTGERKKTNKPAPDKIASCPKTTEPQNPDTLIK